MSEGRISSASQRRGSVQLRIANSRVLVVNEAGEMMPLWHDIIQGARALRAPETLAVADAIFRPLRLCLVPPGKFVMGARVFGSSDRADEHPSHEVMLSRSVEFMSTPVTRALYYSILGSIDDKPGSECTAMAPASWFDAVRFANLLSEAMSLPPAYAVAGVSVEWNRDSVGWRLPTEAEWEYACRGADGASDRPIDEVAWFRDNAGGLLRPVGLKAENFFGLQDTLGGVREWCWDWFGSYDGGLAHDPEGPRTGTLRVLRGGSWFSPRDRVHCSARAGLHPDEAWTTDGFRLVRNHA